MAVQAFSFPMPETRFFQVGQQVYKFKIRQGSKISCEEELLDSEFVSEELEDAVRVVLMCLDNLHPFTTQHFTIFPYKSRWERVSELSFRKGDVKLSAYPFLITLYVETNDPVPQHTMDYSCEWVPPSSESGSDSPYFPPRPAWEPKRRRTEQTQEGAQSLDNQHSMADFPHPHHLQESPYLADSAEGMACGSELHADSEVPSHPAPGAKNPATEDESRTHHKYHFMSYTSVYSRHFRSVYMERLELSL
uniref:Membrane anchored junction protein n=1 Tax=Astyanax mexicanus TaxID=7994 RepID=A0A3B1JT37_ASTMX